MYSHIMGMDDELWDILEEGDGDLKLDEEGVALDRKAHTAEQNKLYKKHHTIRALEKKRKVASTARKLDTSLLNVQTCRKTNPKTNLRSQSSNPTCSRSKSRRA